jgi:hypothetical protein
VQASTYLASTLFTLVHNIDEWNVYVNHNSDRQPKTIRFDDRIYHQDRVAAVTAHKNMGELVEEVIREILRRDGPSFAEGDQLTSLKTQRSNE